METARTLSRPSVLVKGFQGELELLTRHIRLLQFVQKHGPIGIIRLSTLLGVPKHKVRYSLRILEKEGYIKPSTQGAMSTEKVALFFEQIKTLLAGVTKEVHDLLDGLEKADARHG